MSAAVSPDHTFEIGIERAIKRYYSHRPADRGGPGCLNRISASISGASAKVRLPSVVAAG
jgi:hypothetical protein